MPVSPVRFTSVPSPRFSGIVVTLVPMTSSKGQRNRFETALKALPHPGQTFEKVTVHANRQGLLVRDTGSMPAESIYQAYITFNENPKADSPPRKSRMFNGFPPAFSDEGTKAKDAAVIQISKLYNYPATPFLNDDKAADFEDFKAVAKSIQEIREEEPTSLDTAFPFRALRNAYKLMIAQMQHRRPL